MLYASGKCYRLLMKTSLHYLDKTGGVYSTGENGDFCKEYLQFMSREPIKKFDNIFPNRIYPEKKAMYYLGDKVVGAVAVEEGCVASMLVWEISRKLLFQECDQTSLELALYQLLNILGTSYAPGCDPSTIEHFLREASVGLCHAYTNKLIKGKKTLMEKVKAFLN